MQTNLTPAPSGRRAAASWVAGTGAFLLLAAAALFVAVNWDRIPPGGKLAIVVGLTGACLGIGARLRSTLPATGDVLVHLGALLVTVDVAAVGLHREFSFEQLVLAEGVVCSVVYLALAEAFRSVVLRWAADAAVIVAAVGVDLTTDVAAGVPLAVAAVVALAAGRARSATVLAVVAGLAPLAGATPAWAAVGVGVTAAVVLGLLAERQQDERLAFSAAAVSVIGAVSAVLSTGLPYTVEVVGAAGAFVALELLVMAFSADPFWGRPSRVLGGLAEAAAGVVSLPIALGLLGTGVDVSGGWDLALVVTAVGWLAADYRRGEQLSAFTVPAAVVLGATGLIGGLVGVGLLVVAARRQGDEMASVCTLTSVALLFASVLGAYGQEHAGGAIVLLLVGSWAIAYLTDDFAPRAAMVLPLVSSVFLLTSDQTIAVGLLAAVLFAVDAVRHDSPVMSLGSALAAQVVVGSMAVSVGLETPAVGVTLAVAALVWAGLGAVVEDYWRLPFMAAAGMGIALGFSFSFEDPRALSDVLVAAGALVLGLGVVRRSDEIGHVGGFIAILGVFGHLGASGVSAPEAYALPVALHLVAAGMLARRRDGEVSSWWAYAPAVVVLGGIALGERIGGGESWHALVAGGVGVAAVALGGWHRLAGPLFTGTALLIGVAVYESLGTLAGTPTWAWLATGGMTLLGVGVALERSDQSPVEVGRRLVDVVQERFS